MSTWAIRAIYILVTGRLVISAYAQAPVAPLGTGTDVDPFQIVEIGNLVWIGDNVSISTGKYYVLQNNIDASVTAGWNGGAGFTPIGTNSATAFRGIFNGNSRIISNLMVNVPYQNYVGLFGYVSSSGQVINLSLENSSVAGFDNVGGLVGFNNGGIISNCNLVGGAVLGEENIGGLVGNNYSLGAVINCSASLNVLGQNFVGGLVGYSKSTIIGCHSCSAVVCYKGAGGLLGYGWRCVVSNSCATGEVSGNTYVGGVAGLMNDGCMLINCYATGKITGYTDAGGLVGWYGTGTISKCYANGDVIGNSSVGGLLGKNEADLASSCYASGAVTGTGGDSVGGLIGVNVSGVIANCYASGRVNGFNYVGGFVGMNGGPINCCYASGAVSGSVFFVGGLIGFNLFTVQNSYWDMQTSEQTSSDGGIGTNTAAMLNETTFTGWDFTNVWGMVEGIGYPYLRDFVWNHEILLPPGLPLGVGRPDYVGWVVDRSITWKTNDFSSISTSDFTYAWIVNEQPETGLSTNIQFTVSSFNIGVSNAVISLTLNIGGINKKGFINGAMVVEGATSLQNAWDVVASQQIGDNNVIFTEGKASILFAKPDEYFFLRPGLIQLPTPTATTIIVL